MMQVTAGLKALRDTVRRTFDGATPDLMMWDTQLGLAVDMLASTKEHNEQHLSALRAERDAWRQHAQTHKLELRQAQSRLWETSQRLERCLAEQDGMRLELRAYKANFAAAKAELEAERALAKQQLDNSEEYWQSVLVG